MTTIRGLWCAAWCVLGLPGLGWAEQPSNIAPIEVDRTSEGHLRVRLQGTGAPNFVVSSAQEPAYRVSVDIFGRYLKSADTEVRHRPYAGLRNVRIHRIDQESETLTRVTVVLEQERRYWVRTSGSRIELLVAGPFRPGPVVRAEAQLASRLNPPPQPVSIADDLPNGPLTERSVRVPEEPPNVLERPHLASVAERASQAERGPTGAVSPRPSRQVHAPPPPADRRRRARANGSESPVRRLGSELPPPRAPSRISWEPSALPVPEGVPLDGPVHETLAAVPRQPPALSRRLREAQLGLNASRSAGGGATALSRWLTSPSAEVPRRVFARPVLATAEPPPREAEEPVELPVPAESPPAVKSPPAPTPEPLPESRVPPRVERLATFTPEQPKSHSGPREEPTSLVAAAPTREKEPSAPSCLLTYIGFRQVAGTSRVFVRLDKKVRYRIQEPTQNNTLVVELLNTRVNVENNTRPLDTSFFPGPVRLVQAKPAGDSTRIHVQLRSPAAWSIKRVGTTLAVDFEVE